MANDLMKLKLELQLDGDKAVVTGLERVSDSASKVGTSAGRMGSEANKGADGLGRLAGEGRQTISTLRLLSTSIAAVTIGRFTRDVVSAGMAMQELNGIMAAATGSQAQSRVEMNFARKEAERLGQGLEVAVRGYAKLNAAGKGTAISQAEIRETWLGVVEAATVLRISSDNTAGAIRALEQIMSKGTVQAEELRGQLGERIPGAFQIAARAMGVTTQELNKMLEQGQVLSDDFLPKFGRQLREEFGGQLPDATRQLRAELGRLDTAWFELKETLSEKGFTDTATEAVRTFTGALKELTQTIDGLSQQESTFKQTIDWLSRGSWQIISFLQQGMAGGLRSGDLPESSTDLKLRGNAKPLVGLGVSDTIQVGYDQRMLELALQSNTFKPSSTSAGQQNSWTKDELKAFAASAKSYTDTWQLAIGDRNAAHSRSLDILVEEENRLIKEAGKIKDTWLSSIDDRVAADNRALDIIVQREKDAVQAVADAWAGMGSPAEFATLGDFSDPLTEGVGTAVAAMDRLIDSYDTQLEKMRQIEEQRKRINLLEDSEDKARELEKLAKYETALTAATIKSQLGGYRELFGTTKDLFDEQSKERKRLHQAELAMGAIETAMALQKAIANAVVAVTTQGQGDPYTAFARVAAMSAMMAGILSQIGGTLSSGSGGSAPSGFSSTGMVLGDSSAASSSLTDSLDMLDDIQADQYSELQKIYGELKDLNRNITGLVSGLVRSFGDFSGSALGISGLGTEPTWMTSAAEMPFTFINDLFGRGGDFINGLFGSEQSDLFRFASLPVSVSNDIGEWLAGSLFGKTTTKITGSGVQIDPTSIASLLAGDDINASQYADIKIKTKSLFGSDTKRRTQYGTIGDEAQRLLTDMFVGLSDVIVGLTDGLGGDIEAALAYSFDVGKINLKDLTGDEIAEKMAEVFSYAGDVAAQTIFGDIIARYQQINEGPLETAVRLIAEQAVVLDQLSKAGIDANGDLLALTQSIVNFAGGIETLQESWATYYDAFFSDEEKLAHTAEFLQVSLGQLGLALPETRAGFRNLVESLDLSEESGQRAYAALLDAAGAADVYYEALEKQADAVGQLATWQQQLQDQVAQAETALAAAYQAEAAELKTTIDQFDRFAKSLREFREELWLGDESPLSLSQRDSLAGSRFDDIARRAQLGDVSAIEQLQQVSSDYLAVGKESAASAEDYYQRFARVQHVLEATEGVSTRQSNIASSQLSALETQVGALITINSSVLSVRDAIANLDNAKAAAELTDPGLAEIQAAYSSLFGRTGEASGVAYWQSTGLTGSALQDAMIAAAREMPRNYSVNGIDYINSYSSFASGGYHTGGLRIVGEEGPELEATGPARIYNAEQTKRMLGTDNSALVAEVRALRKEVTNLRAAGEATARNTHGMKRKIERWDGDGMPETREVSA